MGRMLTVIPWLLALLIVASVVFGAWTLYAVPRDMKRILDLLVERDGMDDIDVCFRLDSIADLAALLELKRRGLVRSVRVGERMQYRITDHGRYWRLTR